MKKILFAIALVMTLGMVSNAQSDGFFRGSDSYDGRESSQAMPMLPSGNVGSINGDQPATTPLGSGLLIMTALGGAYLLKRRKE